jgi:glycosyltransferase involved in cell wall biosynthesis
MIHHLSSLIVLPSSEYAKSYAKSGVPVKKLLGALRGIDYNLFNPHVDGKGLRLDLGLNQKFVIGWFGNMHSYRQVKEVLIPLIEKTKSYIANVHFVIGGRGELKEEFLRLKKESTGDSFTLLDFVPHESLPSYISGCDLLLCPLSTRFQFTQLSASLKILESVAVGKPIVATRTQIASGDYKDLKGVVWAGDDAASFLDAVIRIHNNYSQFAALARQQAEEFAKYTIKFTIAKITDAIIDKCCWRNPNE